MQTLEQQVAARLAAYMAHVQRHLIVLVVAREDEEVECPVCGEVGCTSEHPVYGPQVMR